MKSASLTSRYPETVIKTTQVTFPVACVTLVTFYGYLNRHCLSCNSEPSSLKFSLDVRVQPSKMEESQESCRSGTGSILRDSQGWDGKLRMDKQAVITNATILSDPEYSDEDAPPVEQIGADEGKSPRLSPRLY